MRSPTFLLLSLAAALLASGCGSDSNADSKKDAAKSTPAAKESAHDADTTPGHGSDLADAPLNVTINLSTDLAANKSEISVTDAEGTEVTVGEPTVVGNGTSLQQELQPGVPDGTYTVDYSACEVEGNSCTKESYDFTVDRSKADDYLDMRGKKQITIDMKDTNFTQRNVVVSPGTKVTWVNQDAADHYVNTDTHPAHTYYEAQNSRGISTGEKYAVTFEKPGVYPYHCSAHTDMTATLVVRA